MFISNSLREYKFKRSFLGTVNPICICRFDIKTLNHLLIHWPRFTKERQSLLLNIERIISETSRKTDTSITSIILYGDPNFPAELTPTWLHITLKNVWIYFPLQRLDL